ncbi:MAG: hypothetical protein ACRC2H_00870, partial [Silanimonas sp.]
MDELKRASLRRIIGGPLGPSLYSRQVAASRSLTAPSARPGYDAGLALANEAVLPNAAPPARVIQYTAAGGASSDSTTTAGITTSSGSSLVVLVHWQSTSTPPTITDSRGNTWTQVGATVSPVGGPFSQHFAAFKCEAATTGSAHTFTASKVGGFTSIYAIELTGASIAAGASASQATGPYTSGDATVSGAALLLAFGAVEGSGQTQFIPGSGFRGLTAINDPSFWQGQAAIKEVDGGTHAATFSTVNAVDGGALLLVVTAPAGGGGVTGSLSATEF